METNMNRRDFIRNTGLTAVAAMIPAGLMSSPLSVFYADSLDPGEEFSLLKLKSLFPEYQFPHAEYYSTRDFELAFKLYNCYGDRLKDAGEFSILKQVGKQPSYQIKSIRNASADQTSHAGIYDYYFTGKVRTSDNILATPLSWECETKIAPAPDAKAYMDTGHSWKGAFKNGKISYESGTYRTEKVITNKDLSWKWGLINAVQMMDPGTELHFSALDEMDMVYEHQVARFRKNQVINTGSRKISFRVFDVTGDGIIPTVYWVDDMDRVVFIITGMEAFVLQ